MTDKELRESLADTLTRLLNEIARLRLTDAEREAIEASMHGENDATVIATLRNLLERLS